MPAGRHQPPLPPRPGATCSTSNTVASRRGAAARRPNRYSRDPSIQQRRRWLNLDGRNPQMAQTRWQQLRLVGTGQEPLFPLQFLNFLSLLLTASFLPSLHAPALFVFLILCALLVTMIGSRADHCITNDHGQSRSAPERQWPSSSPPRAAMTLAMSGAARRMLSR